MSVDLSDEVKQKYSNVSCLLRCPKVAYIESDVGQSEFTPCGLVSLNILDSPIFGSCLNKLLIFHI